MKKFSILLALILCLAALTACGSNVEKSCFDSVKGDYQIVADEDGETWWHLFIGDYEGKPYLSIYDSEAGNPGVEGVICNMDDSTIKVKCDPDLTDELPSNDWVLAGDYLELNYEKTDKGVVLENTGAPLTFKEDSE